MFRRSLFLRSPEGNHVFDIFSLCFIESFRFETSQTLTYDDIMILFKKFQGSVRGTVQYVGSLTRLLDVPSMQVAVRKLVKAYQLAERTGAKEFEKVLIRTSNICYFKSELLQVLTSHADPNGRLALQNLRDGLRVLFERFGIPHKSEELMLLAHKFVSSTQIQGRDDNTADIACSDVMEFCKDESDRQAWTAITKNLRLCATKAFLTGLDIEAMLSAYDTNSDHFISVHQLKEFLACHLVPHGGLSSRCMDVICRRFSEPHKKRLHTHGNRFVTF